MALFEALAGGVFVAAIFLGMTHGAINGKRPLLAAFLVVLLVIAAFILAALHTISLRG